MNRAVFLIFWQKIDVLLRTVKPLYRGAFSSNEASNHVAVVGILLFMKEDMLIFRK